MYVAPEPVCFYRGLTAHIAAPKLGLHETVELLTSVFGASKGDPYLSALSAALKTKMGLPDRKRAPSYHVPRLHLLMRDVKSCRGIHSSPRDTCPSPFHSCVRTVPVCNIADTSEAEMQNYGLVALAAFAITDPSPPPRGTGYTGVPGRGKKATFRLNFQKSIPKNCESGRRTFPSFYSSLYSLPGPAPAVPLPPVIPADLLRINACIYQNPGSKTKNIENRKYNPPSTLNGNQIPQVWQ